MGRFLTRLRSYLGLHLLRVFMVRLEDGPPLMPLQSGLRYAALTEGELLAWCRDPELELDEQRMRAALRRGDLCVGVSDQGTPVGYVWFAFRSAPHVHDTWVRLPSGARYLYKAFIRPSYRGRGIAPEMYVRASRMCPRRGMSFGVLTVDADNSRGLSTALRSGWNPVGSAGFWLLPPWALPFRSAGARRYGFAFTGSACAAAAGWSSAPLPARPAAAETPAAEMPAAEG
jgi:ribosomal protein S18 acetylase RimI-like enzyme